MMTSALGYNEDTAKGQMYSLQYSLECCPNLLYLPRELRIANSFFFFFFCPLLPDLEHGQAEHWQACYLVHFSLALTLFLNLKITIFPSEKEVGGL